MSYGTIADHNVSPDLEYAAPNSRARRPSGVPTEKLKVVNSQGAVASSSRTDDNESDNDDASQYSAQAGVKKLEAIASTWSPWSLYVAYFGICLLAYATSLENQTTVNLTIYATSAFRAHSLVATVLVIQNIVLSVVKPPMAKIADVFGRFEAFTLSVFIYSLGYVQQAASDNVKTYAAAQIFYSAGSTGLQILIMIFIADTSDLRNRALCSALPTLPFLVNVWIGPPLADKLLTTLSWRWGYGIWAIVLPIAYLPLALSLWTTQRKAARLHLLPKSPLHGLSYKQIAKSLWHELDVFGLLLLCVGLSLLLIPLTLAAKNGWDDPSLLAMLLIGAACLAVFPFWEKNKKLAPRAFFPFSLFKNRTVLAGVGISFFYFSKSSAGSTSCDAKLTKSSGILPLRLPLLSIVPFGRPGQIRHRRRSHCPNVDFRSDYYRSLHRRPDQVREPLQVLCHPRRLHILPRYHLDDLLPSRRCINRSTCCYHGSCWDWWRYACRTCTAGRSSIC
jgi:MFS family permease